MIDDYPTDWLENVEADRVAEVTSICKTVASRVHDGDFCTLREIMRELPLEALRGIVAQREHAG